MRVFKGFKLFDYEVQFVIAKTYVKADYICKGDHMVCPKCTCMGSDDRFCQLYPNKFRKEFA